MSNIQIIKQEDVKTTEVVSPNILFYLKMMTGDTYTVLTDKNILIKDLRQFFSTMLQSGVSFFREGNENEIPNEVIIEHNVCKFTTLNDNNITSENTIFMIPGKDPEIEYTTFSDKSSNSYTFHRSFIKNMPLPQFSKLWHKITGSYIEQFIGPYGPFIWKKNNRIQKFSNCINIDISVVTTSEQDFSKMTKEVHNFSCYCDKCNHTFFWRGDCMTCASIAGVNINERCIGGEGTTYLQDGSTCLIKNLKVGDIVRTAGGYIPIKDIIVDSLKLRNMCKINGVVLTEDHPVFIQGDWVLPMEYAPDDVYKDRTVVYNFVMDANPIHKDCHTIIVDGLICATLGRGPENLKERFPEVDALWGTGFWN